MARVTIRRARPSDGPRVVELLADIAVAAGQSPDLVRLTEEMFQRDGFGEGARFGTLIAESGGECAGCLIFFRKYNTWIAGPGLYVEDIVVDRRFRGRGLGRALMAALASIGVEEGAQFIDLAVDEQNPAAGFYERIGMHVHGGWVPYRLRSPELEALARSASAVEE